MAKEKKEVTSLHEYIIESAAKKGKTPADWFDAMVMHMNECHLASHVGKFTNPDIKTTICSHSDKVAGYVTTQGGTPWAVVGIVNHPNASQGRPALDALLEWVANQPR